jgi:hypothetical protein
MEKILILLLVLSTPLFAQEGYNDKNLKVIYKQSSNEYSYYSFFSPAIPKDVDENIYNKLWDLNWRTIKAGKYDYNAFNYNSAEFIYYNESALADDFTFAGVCMNYADFMYYLINHDEELLPLVESKILYTKSSSTHKWLEYKTEKNRYIIDPTWCDWDFVGTPKGQYASNIEFEKATRTSFNKEALISAKSRSWFFRNVKTVTKANDKRAHGLK